ncbi:hypothetical protein [Thalassolituus pacificus]|uniref:Uncharacterized protein n=1 Tax=Thalassolituus pacificus TaxID=2975440 RepID=A0A9X2WBP5_9GAMM|nr:hypothetical protein [Thalassolituus pacificus]MCT7357561.1 hypothetical protein [Thalassolituus pacificus]
MAPTISIPQGILFVLVLMSVIGIVALFLSLSSAFKANSLPSFQLAVRFKDLMKNRIHEGKQQIYHYGPFKWWLLITILIEIPLVALFIFQTPSNAYTFPFEWYQAFKNSGLPFDILAASLAIGAVVIAIHRSELSQISHERDTQNDMISNFYSIRNHLKEELKEFRSPINKASSDPSILFSAAQHGNYHPHATIYDKEKIFSGKIQVYGEEFNEQIKEDNQLIKICYQTPKNISLDNPKVEYLYKKYRHLFILKNPHSDGQDSIYRDVFSFPQILSSGYELYTPELMHTHSYFKPLIFLNAAKTVIEMIRIASQSCLSLPLESSALSRWSMVHSKCTVDEIMVEFGLHSYKDCETKKLGSIFMYLSYKLGELPEHSSLLPGLVAEYVDNFLVDIARDTTEQIDDELFDYYVRFYQLTSAQTQLDIITSNISLSERIRLRLSIDSNHNEKFVPL